MKFRKKPVVVEAVQWTGKNMKEITKLGPKIMALEEDFLDDDITIETLEGKMTAKKGDWIIRGVKGEYYPCKPDIFEATYEAI